jgi:hypothetical protein
MTNRVKAECKAYTANLWRAEDFGQESVAATEPSRDWHEQREAFRHYVSFTHRKQRLVERTIPITHKARPIASCSGYLN